MKNKAIDVLFINPNIGKKAYQDLSNYHSAIEPPTWSLLLASAVIKNDFSCAILDCEALGYDDKEAFDKITYLAPRLVCFVLYGQNPNSGTTLMIGADQLASHIKENSEFKICMIGSHVSALPKEVLSKKYVDFIFYNEGVLGLIELLKTNLKDNLNKVSSLGYKDNGKPILNVNSKIVSQNDMDIVMPDYPWHLLPYKNKPFDLYRAHYWHTFFKDKNRSPFAAPYSSLGCRFGCNFCMINIVNRTNPNDNIHAANSKQMRHWSPKKFLDNITELSRNYNLKTLRLSDEMFFLNKKFYIPILKGIIDRKLDLNIWAYARVDTIREDQLDLFKRAGVNWLALGIEAGNKNVRLEIEKGKFKDTNIYEVVKKIKSFDINVLGNYIFGFPDDTIDTMNETLNLAIELNTEHANFYSCSALPGSPLYYYAIEKGWEMPRSYNEYAFLSYECKPLRTKFLNSKDVLSFRDKAWNKYFTNLNYLNMIEKKFGSDSKNNILEMSKIKLKRKLLDD